jgi:hypothetical protein
MRSETIPRLPGFGWPALAGSRDAGMSCVLDLPNLHFATSGRASILLALEALGVGAGDRVLLPTYHCPTMVAPVTHVGAEPLFYPIDSRGRPDLQWLAAQPADCARALLAPHYFGLPQPMGCLRTWCDERGILLIEDCAHALFGQAGERPVGQWGDAAVASLTKFLPVPEGGCLVLKDGKAPPRLTAAGAVTQVKCMVDMLEVGASQGQITGLNTLISGGLGLMRRLRGGPDAAEAEPVQPVPGDTASGDELTIDAALAHRALAAPARWAAGHLPRERIVSRRRAHYAWLARALAGQEGLRPLMPELPADCAPYVFPLSVDRPDPGYLELRRLGMAVFRWDRLWPGVPRISGDHGCLWSHHVIQLACHQDLDRAQLEMTVSALRRLYAAP